MTGFFEHYRQYISYIIRDVLPGAGMFLSVMAFAFAPPWAVAAFVAYSTSLFEFSGLAFMWAGTIGMVVWMVLVATPVLLWLDEREEGDD